MNEALEVLRDEYLARFDRMAEEWMASAISRNSGLGLLKLTPEHYRAYLKQAAPAVFLLHSAAWRAGYVVNGVEP